MKTTLQLDSVLIREAGKVASESGCSLTAFVEDALREALVRHRNRGNKRAVKFTTFGGRGLRPGVDLDDSASLHDFMEREPSAKHRMMVSSEDSK